MFQALGSSTMAEDIALLEKRTELKHQLATGAYKTLIDRMWDGVGYLIQKLTRNSEVSSFWFSAVVFALITLLISFLTSIFLGEFYPQRRNFIPLEILFVGIGLAFPIAVKIYSSMLSVTLRDYILDAIESTADLADLQRWLALVSDKKKHLFFSLVYTILMSFYGLILFMRISGGFFGFGPAVLLIILNFLVGTSLYYFLPNLTLPIRLSRYQFKLYTADPSSSEVIGRLSGLLTNVVYLGAILATISTLLFVSLGLLETSLIIMFLLVWGLLAAGFAINQYALAKIITNAKWKTLSDIQTKVEKLATEENIADKEKMEALNRLMDYHDRIKATRNSALDLRAGLNFLNSLLLPLIAFVLSNLDKIVAYFA
jgi:hypothetical protein